MIRRFLLVLAFPTHLAAQDPKVKTTALTADFGFVNASGNTSVTTINLGNKFVANTADKKVVFTQLFSAVRSEADGTTNAENYRAQLRLDYGLGGRWYLYGLTGWDRNVPAGVSRRFEETVGLSYLAVRLPNDELGLEVGLSLFQQRNVVPISPGVFDDNFKAGRAAASFKHNFTKTSFFTQMLELIPNFDDGDDFRLNSETAVTARISTNIGLKLGYLIRYDNLPGLVSATSGQRLEKTDRFVTAGITLAY
ncbi:MAG: YdiY family protein [Gemmatimonadales bacterium]